jgi:hypothetical protein
MNNIIRYIPVKDNPYGLDNSQNFWNPILLPDQTVSNFFDQYKTVKELPFFYPPKDCTPKHDEPTIKPPPQPPTIITTKPSPSKPPPLPKPSAPLISPKSRYLSLVDISEFIRGYNTFMRTVFYIYNSLAEQYNKYFNWYLNILPFKPLDAGDGLFFYNQQLIDLEHTLKKNIDGSYKLIISIMDPVTLERFQIPEVIID